MYHLLNGVLVVVAQVNGAGGGLAELAAAGAIKEAGAGTHDGAVDGPLSVIACDGQVRVFASKVESVHMSVPCEVADQNDDRLTQRGP